jgi:hypothetical protein
MPSGLKRFQKAESLHFITFSCFHRLPLLETPGAWETSSASRPNKVRTGHPISRGNACRLEIGWATRPTLNLPTNGPNSNQHGAWFAQGDLIHAAGGGNGTGGHVSTGCLVVCTSQYSDFQDATGMSADPPQKHFTIDVDALANQKNADPLPPGVPQG